MRVAVMTGRCPCAATHAVLAWAALAAALGRALDSGAHITAFTEFRVIFSAIASLLRPAAGARRQSV